MGVNFYPIISNDNPLVVEFKDTSNPTPSNWYWEFGDGETEEGVNNPFHVYGDFGFYTTRLTIDGSTDPANIREYSFSLTPFGPGLSKDISYLIDRHLPDGINISQAKKDILITDARLTIARALKIEQEQFYNELQYPPLANALIVQLVIYNYITESLKVYLSSLNNAPGIVTVATVNGNAVSGRELRKVQTGPSEAEWFSTSNLWGTLTKGSGGSIIDLAKQSICSLASQLRIYLDICPKYNRPFVPEVYKPTFNNYHSTKNPETLLDNFSSLFIA